MSSDDDKRPKLTVNNRELLDDVNSNEHQNKPQLLTTETDMMCGYFANRNKIKLVEDTPQNNNYSIDKNDITDLDIGNVSDDDTINVNLGDEQYPKTISSAENYDKSTINEDNKSTINDDNKSAEKKIYNNTETEVKNDDSDMDIFVEKPHGNRFMKPGEKRLSPDEEYIEKIKLLAKIEVIENQVKFSRKFTMRDDYYEMKFEYELKKNIKDRQNGINLSKGFLMNAVSAIEFLNDRYDPFDFKLKGWSESMHCDIDSYDEVFGELYDKYRDKGGKMAPEIKLLLMLSSSAVQFHLSKTIFSSPPLGDALKNNPQLFNKLMGKNDKQQDYEMKMQEMQNLHREQLDMMKNQLNNMKMHIGQQVKQNEHMDNQYMQINQQVSGPKNSTEILNMIKNQQRLKDRTTSDVSSDAYTESPTSGKKKKRRSQQKKIFTIDTS